MVPFLQWSVGAIVWALANAVYADMRRKGSGDSAASLRWVGFPVSFLWVALVKEGRPLPPETSEDDLDDVDELLHEVPRDREARPLSGRSDDA